MKTVNTKLTLLVLVFPLAFVIAVFSIIIYVYSSSFNALTILDSISAIVSIILVNILVWERLRESLIKKLQYMHENSLFQLHQQLKSDVWGISQNTLQKARFNLERYGKFFFISLYPKGILKEIDAFSSLYSELSKAFQIVQEQAKKLLKKTSVNKALLQELLELKEKRSSSYSQDALWKYREVCKTITKEQTKTIEQMKNYLSQMREKKKIMFEQLDSFIKSNNLSLNLY